MQYWKSNNKAPRWRILIGDFERFRVLNPYHQVDNTDAEENVKRVVYVYPPLSLHLLVLKQN